MYGEQFSFKKINIFRQLPSGQAVREVKSCGLIFRLSIPFCHFSKKNARQYERKTHKDETRAGIRGPDPARVGIFHATLRHRAIFVLNTFNILIDPIASYSKTNQSFCVKEI